MSELHRQGGQLSRIGGRLVCASNPGPCCGDDGGGDEPGIGIFCSVRGETSVCENGALAPISEEYTSRVFTFEAEAETWQEQGTFISLRDGWGPPYTRVTTARVVWRGIFGIDLFHASEGTGLPDALPRMIAEYGLDSFDRFLPGLIGFIGTGLLGFPFLAYTVEAQGQPMDQTVPVGISVVPNVRGVFSVNLGNSVPGACGIFDGRNGDGLGYVNTSSQTGSPIALQVDNAADWFQGDSPSGPGSVRDFGSFARFTATGTRPTESLPSHWRGPSDFAVCDRSGSLVAPADDAGNYAGGDGGNGDAVAQHMAGGQRRGCSECGQ